MLLIEKVFRFGVEALDGHAQGSLREAITRFDLALMADAIALLEAGLWSWSPQQGVQRISPVCGCWD